MVVESLSFVCVGWWWDVQFDHLRGVFSAPSHEFAKAGFLLVGLPGEESLDERIALGVEEGCEWDFEGWASS